MLTINAPDYIGIIKVIPEKNVNPAMKTSEEIELIGMEVANDFERKNNRNPEDISKENLGYDIRSTEHSEDGKIIQRRYIEVKARSAVGDISLTANEMLKAKRFQDEYFLYVVFNAASTPYIVIIQNPAEKLEANEQLGVVRYIVSSNEINEKGDEVQ